MGQGKHVGRKGPTTEEQPALLFSPCKVGGDAGVLAECQGVKQFSPEDLKALGKPTVVPTHPDVRTTQKEKNDSKKLKTYLNKK